MTQTPNCPTEAGPICEINSPYTCLPVPFPHVIGVRDCLPAEASAQADPVYMGYHIKGGRSLCGVEWDENGLHTLSRCLDKQVSG